MIERIKDICDYVSRGATPDYIDVGENKVMNQATFSKGSLDESNIRYTSKTNISAQIKKGDLLMASTGGGVLGKVFYFDCDDENFYADSHVTILRSSTGKNLMKYLYYHFYLRYDEINATMVKGSTNQTELQRNYLLSYELDMPSFEDQNKMVSYLDSKLSEIDRQVSLLTSKRDAYLRLKKSIINRAVTKGLNPNVKMKDSGVDWIGEVPEGWNVMHMKRALSFNNGRDYKHVEVDEGYPVIGSGGQFAYASEYLYDGEAILFGRKGTIDKPMHINDKFWTVDTMFYAIPKGNAYGRYLFYQANAMPLNKYSTQTALPSMTQTSLQNILICLPPLSEQHSIATYLDDKCSKIDLIISNLDKQISKYGELKRSLIDEVITGKRAV